MVLYAIKSLLLIKDILNTLPSSGINNQIKIPKDSVLQKELTTAQNNERETSNLYSSPLGLYAPLKKQKKKKILKLINK